MKKQDLKVKAVMMYAQLRKLGVSHSLAFAAVIEMIVDSSGVASNDASDDAREEL